MIEEKDIYKCVEDNNAPHIRLFDMNKNLLHTYDEDDNVSTAIDHLKVVLPMYKGYGKIVVNCATPAMKQRRWTGSYHMTCVFDKAAAQIGGPQMTPWNMPAGYIHNDVMMAKLSMIEQSNKHALEMFKIELKMKEAANDKEDPAKQIEKFFPYALYAMGKPLDEIQKVTTAIRIGNSNLSAAGAAPTNTLTFKDIEAKPSDEKQKQFQQLADSISKKVSIEEMIMLYDVIDKDEDASKLIQTALQALPLLKNQA